MEKRLPFDKQTALASLGLGCLLSCVLCVLLGKFPFADFDEAFACQVPLTITGDLGCLCGLAVCAALRKAGFRGTMIEGYSYAFISAGLCVSLLARSGTLVENGPASLIAGDFFTGMFAMACSYAWWMVYAPWEEKTAVRRIALSLAFAGTTFLVLAMLPAEAARLVLSVVLPSVAGLCLLMLAAMRPHASSEGKNADCNDTPHPLNTAEERRQDERNERKRAVEFKSLVAPIASGDESRAALRSRQTIFFSIALSCFVVDLAIALFPVCLFHEESPLLAALVSAPQGSNAPIGTLTQPAFLCALVVIATSIAILIAGKSRPVPLSALYYAGFAMTTFDYVAFPYHFPGGTPLAIAEAGRIVIALFVVVVALRLLENGREDPGPLFLEIGVAAFSAMLIADVLAMAAQMQPTYDYSDFQFRTVFSGVGITALVVLLLGPLSRINRAIEQAGAFDNAEKRAEQEPSLEGRFEQACAAFSSDYGLSAREGEVFGLIANGRDVPYIENELVLAKSTVKTHIKHIYEKCGVSSRQDLLDLFDSYKS